jgi:hypothetical protein
MNLPIVVKYMSRIMYEDASYTLNLGIIIR